MILISLPQWHFRPMANGLQRDQDYRHTRIIEVATGNVKHIIPHDDSVRSVAFSPDGQWLATGSCNWNARLIEVATGAVRRTMKHDDWVRSVAFSPDGLMACNGIR